MTREEARKAAEVMLAYADGKKIEYRVRGGEEWYPSNELDTPLFDWNSTEYRIKPEDTYRPFKDKEECWNEMKEHQPFGWVNFRGLRRIIICLYEVGFSTNVADWKYDEGFREFTFADGTPFGVKE